jgi:hypothetical protein
VQSSLLIVLQPHQFSSGPSVVLPQDLPPLPRRYIFIFCPETLCTTGYVLWYRLRPPSP